MASSEVLRSTNVDQTMDKGEITAKIISLSRMHTENKAAQAASALKEMTSLHELGYLYGSPSPPLPVTMNSAECGDEDDDDDDNYSDSESATSLPAHPFQNRPRIPDPVDRDDSRDG